MRRLRQVSPTAAVFIALAVSLVATGAEQGGAVDDVLRARLAGLPHATHHSEIRADYDATRNQTRVWINTNEDDNRLWSRRGGQMDMEFRVSSVVAGREGVSPPAEVSVDFATLGDLQPAVLPHPLELSADGRSIVLRQSAEPPARSGALLFLSTRTTMSMGEFLRLATSRRVEGRVWGHDFALLESQLEILREYARRLIGI